MEYIQIGAEFSDDYFKSLHLKVYVRVLVRMHHQQQPHAAASQRASEIRMYRNQKHLVHVSAP